MYRKEFDTISLSLANFVGCVVGILNVCTIRLVAYSLPPRYPLKVKWYESNPDKLAKCGNEIIFCRKNAKNKFLLTNDNKNIPGAMFFAAYVGPSMNPTLREPEMMEIVPYDNRPLRVGDVVFFLSPQKNQPVVHRIARLTTAGISTRGDNNTQEDTFLLQPKDIKGQVVAAWHGRKRREIAGGLHGRLTNRWLRWQRVLDRGFSNLLSPLYHALSHRGVIVGLLPVPFQPRVVVFHAQGREQFQLLLGQRIIGRYDDQQHQWQIKRPFRLFVNERVLQRQPDENRTGLSRLIEDSKL